MNILKIAQIIFILLLFNNYSFAQLELHPIQNAKKNNSKNKINTSHLRRDIHDPDTLTLPFFDDFSYNNIQADTNKWMFNEGVLINNTYAITPPTYGTAIFDGIDLYGNVYSFASNAIGYADSLESLYINLKDTASVSIEDNVYLSFYWNGGLGIDDPDESEKDSIILQFRDSLGVWKNVWPIIYLDENNNEVNEYVDIFDNLSDTFLMKRVEISDPIFFHDAFQFRFLNHGRLSGSYDIWSIDYVLLSSDTIDNLSTNFEVAMSQQLTPIFDEYTSIPLEQFLTKPDVLLADNLYSTIHNLSDRDNNIKGFGNVFINEQFLTTLDIDLNPDPDINEPEFLILEAGIDNGNDRVPFSIQNFSDFNLTSHNAGFDTLGFHEMDELVFTYQIGHDLSQRVDTSDVTINVFRNDTMEVNCQVSDYFAYDDGSAEYGVSHRQKFGKVAYKYKTIEPDTLTHIDMYITQLEVNLGSPDQPFDLIVWQEIDNEDGKEDIEISRQTVNFSEYFYAPTINQFSRIELKKPLIIGKKTGGVTVENEFYIGYEQSSETPITIGFDINTNSAQNIYSNLSANWVPSQLSGSLMIRPVFDDAIITGIEDDEHHNNLLVFPNPVKSVLKIKGKVEKISLYSINGIKILDKLFITQENKSIDITGLKPGLYYLRLFNGNSIINKKIVVQN